MATGAEQAAIADIPDPTETPSTGSLKASARAELMGWGGIVRDTTPTEAPPVVAQAEAPQQRDFNPDAERGRQIEFSGETRAVVADVIASRLRNINAQVGPLRQEGRLDAFDQLLQAKGAELLKAWEEPGAVLTRDQIALAWSLMQDQVFQDRVSTGRTVVGVEEQVVSEQRRRLRDIIRGRRPEPQTQIRTDVIDAVTPRLTSDTMQQDALLRLNPDVQDEVIASHNDARVALETALGFTGPGLTTGEFTEFSGTHQHLLHDAVEKSLTQILAREAGGHTYVELQREDPVKALQLRHKAIHEALFHASPALAQEAMEAKQPDVDRYQASIDGHLAELTKQPKQEDMEPKIKEQEETNKKLAEAQTAYDKTKQELATAETEVVKAQREFARISREVELKNGGALGAAGGRLDQNIADLEDVTRSIRASIDGANEAKRTAAQAKANPPSGLSGEDLQEFYENQDAVIARQDAQIAQQTANLTPLLDQLNTRRNERSALYEKYAAAEEAKNFWEARTEQLGGPATADGSAREAGLYGTNKAALEAAKAAKEAKDKEIKDLTSPEKADANKKPIEALTQWKRLGSEDNLAGIITIRAEQTSDTDPLSRDKLADTTLEDGQVKGAELLREHIFAATDEGKAWFAAADHKALAREMISDEALARGIVYTMRLDSKDFFDGIDRLNTELALAKNALAEEKAKATPNDLRITSLTTAIIDNEARRTDAERILVGKVFPYLKQATHVDVVNTLNFVIDQGLQQAARTGKYDLKVPGTYAHPEAALPAEVQTVLDADMGTVAFDREEESGNPLVAWDGKLGKVNAAIFGGGFSIDPNIKLDMQIVQEFSRDETRGYQGIETVVYVDVTQELLSVLPTAAPADMPEQLRNSLYDENGLLRTEIRPVEEVTPIEDSTVNESGYSKLKINIDLGEIRAAGSGNMLSRLDALVSQEAGNKVSIATANEVLSMRPFDRLAVVHGFLPTDVEFPSTSGAAPTTHTIEMDNDGQFWIQEAGGDHRELSSFLAEQEEEERASLNVQQLDTDQRRALQDRLIEIQKKIGETILITQQARGVN